LRREGNQIFIQLCDKSHPVFQAHFPNNPIVPGFVLIDLSALLLGLNIQRIVKAKFLKPVLPQSILCFDVREKEHSVKIVITHQSQKVAELLYEKR
jgi:3-hydroxyacyl-[acyl-carrier-protein] dehydratase